MRLKILNRKDYPFINKIKVYGVSIDAILILSFALIVLVVLTVYLKRPAQKSKVDVLHQSALSGQHKLWFK